MNAVFINLVMTLFWLCLGGALLFREWQTGQIDFAVGAGINVGWLAVLFAAFNLFRAWANWTYVRRRRQQAEDEEALRRQWNRHRTEEPRQPPDPNFQFTDEPENPS